MSSTSTKTGVPPAWTMVLLVAGQVNGVVITSSPGWRSSASSARCMAVVQDETANAVSVSA